MSDITSTPTAKNQERFQKSLKHLDKRLTAQASGTVTSTSILDRARIFAPTSEPAFRDTWTEPDVVPGVCTTQVRGRLGQSHVALLESCLLRHTAEDDADGGMTITVPLVAVLRDMSTLRDYSWTSAMAILQDLCDARVRLSGLYRPLSARLTDGKKSLIMPKMLYNMPKIHSLLSALRGIMHFANAHSSAKNVRFTDATGSIVDDQISHRPSHSRGSGSFPLGMRGRKGGGTGSPSRPLYRHRTRAGCHEGDFHRAD